MAQTHVSPQAGTLSATAVPSGAHVLVALFVASFLIPTSLEIAGLRLSTARLYALCFLIPLAIRWLSKEAGRVLPVDILILCHALWMIVSMFVNHGMAEIPITGMLVVELYCGFLVGRILIREPVIYRWLFTLLLPVMVIMLPFAIHEMLTERALYHEIFRSLLGDAHANVYHNPRMGFYRAQTFTSHPILWGVFCSITIANILYIWADRLPGAFVRAGIAMLATFTSMSAGAVLGAMIQLVLVIWGWVTKGAWKTLAAGFAGIWVFLSFASNRGPVILMITYLTFSPATGWGRIAIFQNGIDDALANPIFGIGLHDWTRPAWIVHPSVDNFWLLMAMRHGFVGCGLLMLGLAWHLYKVCTAKGLTATERRFREGYVIAFVGLIFSLATVHFWGPPYQLFFVYVGAGVWFYARPDQSVALDVAKETASQAGPGRVAFPFARPPVVSAHARRAGPVGDRDQRDNGQLQREKRSVFSRWG